MEVFPAFIRGWQIMVLEQTGTTPEPGLGDDAQPDKAARERHIKILFACGPGDVAGLFRDMLECRSEPFQLAAPFTGQLLELCDEIDADAHFMSWHWRRDQLQFHRHTAENSPQPGLYFGGGWRHYAGALLYGLQIVRQAVRHRASLVVVDSGTTQWMVLSLLWLRRIPVIAVFHNALWPMGFPPTRRVERLLRRLDGIYFRTFASAAAFVSPECERQIHALSGPRKPVSFQFRPQYRREFLSRVRPVGPWPFPTFNILFLGRVEEYKGLSLMLEVAARLEGAMPGHFKWRIHGEGDALASLVHRIHSRGLGHAMTACGMIADESAAVEALSWCHAVIVPTTSQFKEGLSMAAAEGVLAGRPVVVSEVVPAWEILGEAAVKARTDSLVSFVDALLRLAREPEQYAARQRAAAAVQAQFYDRSQGLGAVLGRAIAQLR